MKGFPGALRMDFKRVFINPLFYSTIVVLFVFFTFNGAVKGGFDYLDNPSGIFSIWRTCVHNGYAVFAFAIASFPYTHSFYAPATLHTPEYPVPGSEDASPLPPALRFPPFPLLSERKTDRFRYKHPSASPCPHIPGNADSPGFWPWPFSPCLSPEYPAYSQTK